MEYDSQLVSRVPRSPAHDANDIDDEVDPTLVEPSQICLFDQSNPSEERSEERIIPHSPHVDSVVDNTHNRLLNFTKQISSSSVRTERLCHHFNTRTSMTFGYVEIPCGVF